MELYVKGAHFHQVTHFASAFPPASFQTEAAATMRAST